MINVGRSKDVGSFFFFFFLEVGNVILLECPLVLFRIYGYFLTKKFRIINKESLLNSSIDEYLNFFFNNLGHNNFEILYNKICSISNITLK